MKVKAIVNISSKSQGMILQDTIVDVPAAIARQWVKQKIAKHLNEKENV